MNIWIIIVAAYLAIGLYFGVYYWFKVSRKANSKKNDAAEPETPQETPQAPEAESAGGRFLGSVVSVLVWPIFLLIIFKICKTFLQGFFKGLFGK